MSLLPGQILPQSVPFGRVNEEGALTVDVNWWLFLYNLSQKTLGNGSGLPADALIDLESADTDAIDADAIALRQPLSNALSLAQEHEGLDAVVAKLQQTVSNAFLVALTDAQDLVPQITAAQLAAIANNTVIGNVSGAIAPPTALNQTQLTSLINVFTPLLSGAVPSGGSGGQFLGASGWATPSYPVGGNPSASVGLSAINGTATTYMRSDGSPALSVSIVPTWTGVHTFSAKPVMNAGATMSASSGTTLAVTAPAAGVSIDFTDGTVHGNIEHGSSTLQVGTVSNHPMTFFTNNSTRITIANTGAITVAGNFAINGGTPTAALSGFGSPSGSVTSGLTSGATLAQTAGTLAALLAYLKTIGVIAA